MNWVPSRKKSFGISAISLICSDIEGDCSGLFCVKERKYSSSARSGWRTENLGHVSAYEQKLVLTATADSIMRNGSG